MKRGRRGRIEIWALLCLCLLPVMARESRAETATERRHAIALIGTPRMPPDFKHFDWVNADAPKGGVLRRAEVSAFDTVNDYSFQGVKAPELALLDDTLMMISPDERYTGYGLIAEWVSYPPDVSSATFGLRPQARFNDGTPITPDDVVFSFDALKLADPAYELQYKDVASAQQSGEREVTFRFKRPGNRELPLLVGGLPVVSKAYWTGKRANGQTRDITKSTLEPPIGSGPYRIKALEPGRYITYERVKSYWAADLPVRRGIFNFDEIRYAMFKDDGPAFEAFKSGEFDIWPDGSAKNWATAYDVPPVRAGWIKRLELEVASVQGMQGYLLNLRRKAFQDIRVRRALNLAFNFEDANRNLFFGAYRRIGSFWENSELAARGVPTGRELEILEPLRGKVPVEVFTTPYANPVNATGNDQRAHLREAVRLLAKAGYAMKGGVLTHKETGERLDFEILLYDKLFERIVVHFSQALQPLGLRPQMRIVDVPQYERRVKAFDFDIIVGSISAFHAPGNELREYWGSEAADRQASQNRSGLKDPAVDALIDRVIYAPSRDDVIAATRALDRVLLWNQVVVPQWWRPTTWLAHWDRFGKPARLPSQDPTLLHIWWYDNAAASRLAAAGVR
jgi:microcin C transport system substrate-binding protein